MSTRTVLVVAAAGTSDQAVDSLAAPLRDAGAELTVVDLRPRRGAAAGGRVARALAATTASWAAARRVSASDRAALRDAALVVAADREAVPAVWRARRTNRTAQLVNGLPAALRSLGAT
ncbi:hypothetical protein [Cellulomonas palmilytica]|uniref:hypothetical protein n=1 Tax=Cellulomonas palmilytica TaxID=2608402 RepID=UPI001F3DFD40|nr:hypothetical protein [Cellulomonas palmilytica]UJP39541.1 hypothetical protein F1D97_14655 [Cellulomonas palmilytica]